MIQHNYSMTVKEFTSFIYKFSNYSLTPKEKEYIWDSFRAKDNVEDNPDHLDERHISL